MFQKRSFLVVAFAVIGCDSRQPTPSSPSTSPKIKVEAPGVNVDVNRRDKSVEVDAPGVKVNVDRK